MWWIVKCIISGTVGLGLMFMGSSVDASTWIGLLGSLLVFYSLYAGLRAALWVLAKVFGWFKEETEKSQ